MQLPLPSLYNTKGIEQAKLLEVVNRNTKRLKRLTEDILDVTKTKSQYLNLNSTAGYCQYKRHGRRNRF